MAKHCFEVHVAYGAGESVKQNIEREAPIAGVASLISDIEVPVEQPRPKHRAFVHYSPHSIWVVMEADRVVYDFVKSIDGVSEIADSLESKLKLERAAEEYLRKLEQEIENEKTASG